MTATNNPSVTITESARNHIRAQLAQTQAKYLRLGVKESGCNGFMYMLDFLEAPEANDACFNIADGVDICVRDQDLNLVMGTEVDMITQGLNSALVFKNPKATSYCGCGESFAVANTDAASGEDNAAGLDTQMNNASDANQTNTSSIEKINSLATDVGKQE